ncbi:MAG: hypothetical protein KJO07_06520 [Deltaproteobacteria bacterium]|nr:hypothetical protein [Deltaproteobacteria bacterium]
MRRAALVLALALVATPVRQADAYVLEEDAFEEIATEVGVIIRSFTFLLSGDLLDEPFQSDDQSPLFRELIDLRMYVQHRTRNFKFVFHNALVTTVRSAPALELIGLGRTGGPPRFLPLFVELIDDDNVVLRDDVDWVYASYRFGRLTVTAGRQPVTFGRGQLWSPLDLVGTFALTEVDRDYKPGVDALRLDLGIGDRTNFTLLASAGELVNDEDGDGNDDYDLGVEGVGSTAIGRFTTGSDRWELGLLSGWVRGDFVAGADVVFDLDSINVYLEASATVPIDAEDSPVTDARVVGKAVAGVTVRTGDLTITPELLYNGFGASESGDYFAVASSTRFAIGEQVTLGQVHGGLFANYDISPVLKIRGGGLINMLDPSALASGRLVYDASGSTQLILGVYVPTGDGPEVTAGPGSLPVLRSEFGTYPFFVFSEFKTVL